MCDSLFNLFIIVMETVIITGTNRGIGFELTKQFLQAGFHVIATCRNPEAASDLNNLANDGNLSIFQLDVTSDESVSDFFTSLSGKVVDILINNAGIIGGDSQDIYNMDYKAWIQAFEVNTLAPFRLSAALIPNLKLAKRPRIVTVSSQMGSLNRKSTGSYAYRSSKAAVNKVMQVLSAELIDDGIIVCPVHPGWVQTDMGGQNAEITPHESASGLFELINSLTMEHSGRFWTWQGEEHLW